MSAEIGVKSTDDVKDSVETAYGSFKSVDVSKATEVKDSITSCRVNAIGGDPAFAPDKLEDWQKSVADNLAFMNFTSDGLVAIWDLFPDQEEKLKKAFDEYVAEKRLVITQRSVVEAMYIKGQKYADDADTWLRPEPVLLHTCCHPDAPRKAPYRSKASLTTKILLLFPLTPKYL